NISIERENPHVPSQVLVSEMMILANSIAGSFFSQNNVPAIFRSQDPPEQPIGELTSDQIVEMYQLRKYMKKGVMGLKVARHTGLGLDSYVQITSPIRRYNDLLMQRQLKAYLRSSEPLYTEEELGNFLAYTTNAVSQADYLERDRRNYWILRYLEEHQWEDMEAIVLANHPDKHIVQICNCLWENECPHVPGHPLPPGTHIHVSIESVWPRDCIVRLNPIV
ncbi:RNB domain-containing ribonuclease, partial [bacterium]|nr:RNB domain-containing ribonuclease [bacterium]